MRTSDEVVSSKACEASVAQTSSLGCMTEPMPRTPKASISPPPIQKFPRFCNQLIAHFSNPFGIFSANTLYPLDIYTRNRYISPHEQAYQDTDNRRNSQRRVFHPHGFVRLQSCPGNQRSCFKNSGHPSRPPKNYR